MRPVSYAIIGVSAFAVFVIVIFASQQTPDTADLPVPPQPVFELGMYGETLAHEEAEEIVGYAIKLPSYMPEGNTLRMIKADMDSKWSFMIYSPVPVDDSTREIELMENGGFIIINSPSDTDNAAEVRRFVEFGGEEIIMQNYTGVGFTDIPLMPGYAEIHWWDDGLRRIVGGNYDFEELVRIIESIQN